MERTPCVYITASQRRGTIYIGVTSQPLGRWWEHREGAAEGFTKRYGVKRLVHIEFFGDMEHAILREKQLKRWHRAWKINLIESVNSNLARPGAGLWLRTAESAAARAHGC